MTYRIVLCLAICLLGLTLPVASPSAAGKLPPITLFTFPMASQDVIGLRQDLFKIFNDQYDGEMLISEAPTRRVVRVMAGQSGACTLSSDLNDVNFEIVRPIFYASYAVYALESRVVDVSFNPLKQPGTSIIAFAESPASAFAQDRGLSVFLADTRVQMLKMLKLGRAKYIIGLTSAVESIARRLEIPDLTQIHLAFETTTNLVCTRETPTEAIARLKTIWDDAEASGELDQVFRIHGMLPNLP